MNRMNRKYSTIGYHAHCSIYALRHKYKVQRQNRKFPWYVEQKPDFEMKPLVPEQNTLESVMLIPIERKPRILLEKQSQKAQIERKPNWFDDELESMNLNSRTLLFKLTDRNAENVLEFLNELKPKLEGKRAYFLYSELFKFLIRINRLKILRELIAEYIGERMIYAANDPKLWLPIFTVLKALYRSGQGQRNHILPPQCISI
jgi:hypothetical protein